MHAADTATQEVTRSIEEFNITWGMHGALAMVACHSAEFSTVLDIGSGDGEHSRFFKLFGKETFAVDLKRDADYVGDFMQVQFDRKFDLVWCSHVLEHQRNVGAFLEKVYSLINDDGFLAIALPVHPREQLISGHITSWNAGLLIYNLVLAGFDCCAASFVHTYDLCLIVRKRPARGPDIGAVAAYFPVEQLSKYFPFAVKSGTLAEVQLHNWNLKYTFPPVGRPVRLRMNNNVIGPFEVDVN